MKKKLFSILAATLAFTTLSFSACGSGDSKIIFKNYWNRNAETSLETIDETLVYKVSYTPSESNESNYDITYDGTYVTTLLSQNDDTYRFTSVLNVDVTFTVNGQSETKQDVVETIAIFHKAGGTENLSPVFSYKTITSHSPNSTSNASSPADCYVLYDYKFETLYQDGNGVCDVTRKLFNADYTDYVEATQTYEFSASSSKRTVLDNEQLPVAFRAMPAGTSTNVQMFNPFLGYSQNYKVSLPDETKEKQFTYLLDGEEKKPTLAYRTATIMVSGVSSGQAQWAEIAATADDPTMNLNRNLMLSYHAPLTNGLGVLNYTLTSATYR